MLTLLVAVMLTEGTVCEFPEGHWTMVAAQSLRLEDGTVFAKIKFPEHHGGLTPWASGSLDERRVGSLHVQSGGLNLVVRAPVDVYGAKALEFDDGFTSGDATRLRIVGSQAGSMLVIPADRDDLSHQGQWTPRPLRCDALRLFPLGAVTPSSSDTSISAGTELRTKARGPVTFIAKARLPVHSLASRGVLTEVVVSLDDGARVRAWVDRQGTTENSVTTVVGNSIVSHVWREPPRSCPHSLALQVRRGEQVNPIGELAPGTAFDAVFGTEYADVTPREGSAYELEPGWHWSVKNEDLYACRIEAAPTAGGNCALATARTRVTMEQPLRLPDGAEFGLLAPMPCPFLNAEVISSGVVGSGGSTRVAFQSRGFTVTTVVTPQTLFDKNGHPVPIAQVGQTPSACAGLTLMPAAELPSGRDYDLARCNRSDIDDRWIECGTSVDLYVKDSAENLERVGSVEPKTAIIPLTQRDGFTQVSPFGPVPFRLSNGWTWWVRSAALEGCRQPR